MKFLQWWVLCIYVKKCKNLTFKVNVKNHLKLSVFLITSIFGSSDWTNPDLLTRKQQHIISAPCSSTSVGFTTLCTKVILHKSRGEQFLWNRIELVLGWLAILKKKYCGDYEQLLRSVFSFFKVQTIFFFFLFWKYCSIRSKKL